MHTQKKRGRKSTKDGAWGEPDKYHETVDVTWVDTTPLFLILNIYNAEGEWPLPSACDNI